MLEAGPVGTCLEQPFDTELAGVVNVSFIDRFVGAAEPPPVGGPQKQLVETVRRWFADEKVGEVVGAGEGVAHEDAVGSAVAEAGDGAVADQAPGG